MVAPTGTKALQVINIKPVVWFSSLFSRKANRWQKAPFNLPLAYSKEFGNAQASQYTGSFYGTPPFDAFTITTAFWDTNLRNLVSNQAYERLRGSIYDQAALGVDFVEARQSLDMMAKTCGTIVKSIIQVKKLDFIGAARTLRLHAVPKGVSKRRAWSNNWLEYHFGWGPMFSDIYDAAKVLNNPLKSFTMAKGTAKVFDQWQTSINSGATRTRYLASRLVLCKQGATVRSISSGTIHSLDQFGVLNPLSLALEVIPFSFVVEWFVNIGEVLSSLSDYSGMIMDSMYTSNLHRATVAGVCEPTGPKDPWTNILYYTAIGGTYSRSPNLTAPVFAVKRLKLPSKERAATAVSLVIQQMSR